MSVYRRVAIVSLVCIAVVALLSIFTPLFVRVPYLDKGIMLVLAIAAVALLNTKGAKEDYRYTPGAKGEAAGRK